ncbi:MAG: sensor histidine kinase, partial [Pseudomonadales bacterium]
AFYGGVFTFFFICLGACLFLYITVRERLYLGITLLLAGVVSLYLTLSGVGRLWFWGNTAEFNTRFSYIGISALVIGLCTLGRSLNIGHKYADYAEIVLRFISFLIVPVVFYFLFIPIELITKGNIIPLVVLILGLMFVVSIMVTIKAIQGSQVAIYLVISSVMILITILWQISYIFSVMDRAPGANYLTGGLTVGAAVFMMLALAEFARGKARELSFARMETKAKGDFLKNVSREFLTPVHLILANSKRLMATQSNKLDEPTRQHMTTVIKQSNHLHNLINDLLEMAELESDSFEPEFELVEITHFLNEVKELVSPPALEKGLDINTDFASANLLIQTDRARLQHSLLNVLTNAIRYTDSGSIKIGYKAIYFRRKLGIEIYIQDSGRGMSQEFQQRLFQEFAREDDVSEKNPEGTGLGLVIVKRIIERLGGEITFESFKDVGSTFFIRLPLRLQQS